MHPVRSLSPKKRRCSGTQETALDITGTTKTHVLDTCKFFQGECDGQSS